MKFPLLLVLLGLVISGAAESNAADALYEVTIQNRAKSGLTSIVWATHGRKARLFKRGRKASEGVAELAKDGATGIAKRELKAQQNGARGVHSIGEAFGPGGGGKTTFRVNADTARRLFSWATMAVCSNDTFAGQDGWRLPRALNRPKRKSIRALDAGAEVNTESRDDVPCLGAHGTGPAEDKPIRLSDAIRGDADLKKRKGWGRFIARITVRRIR